ncbi:hypothetical protein BT67DRAFT_36594 [Trichocladium antarcticum]|uniref:Uncharacterized protein n=1 Tax=Trichocladium antarcticum TaxID=1450529 RepID=A0AAN6ZDM1_9PEZI|nr:hypothetical protein BT67DRAFT_36594 [Trichocladium antarcticum]
MEVIFFHVVVCLIFSLSAVAYRDLLSSNVAQGTSEVQTSGARGTAACILSRASGPLPPHHPQGTNQFPMRLRLSPVHHRCLISSSIHHYRLSTSTRAMAKNGKGKAIEEASDGTDSAQSPTPSNITREQIEAMFNTVREEARRNPSQCSAAPGSLPRPWLPRAISHFPSSPPFH